MEKVKVFVSNMGFEEAYFYWRSVFIQKHFTHLKFKDWACLKDSLSLNVNTETRRLV